MKQKTIFIVTAVLLLLVFVGMAVRYDMKRNEEGSRAALANRAVLETMHSPSIGNPNARVVIVEFFDPACETCREFYPLVKRLKEQHPDKIRIIARYAPFHAGSDQVVAILEAARKQGRFWEALEVTFKGQDRWAANHQANVAALWPVLAAAGFDIQRLQADSNSPEIYATIQRDIADASRMGVTATPEFFVNGKALPSFGFDQLKTAVEDALKATDH
jgi:protein-disulfide isomerase